MRKTVKQILSLVAVATLFGSTLAMTACGGDYYKADGLSGYKESNTAATSNGGFAVEKDGRRGWAVGVLFVIRSKDGKYVFQRF